MFNHRVGDYGLTALILTLLLIMLTAGFSLLYSLVWTLVVAARLPSWVDKAEAYVVPGKQLINDLPDQEFMRRLEKVKQLWHQCPVAIYALGGRTYNNTRTEAAVAGEILLESGVDKEAVFLEQISRHTLENLQCIQPMVEHCSELTLISNRYHLPRLIAMANAIPLSVVAVAAEEHLALSPDSLTRWIKEAFYNHWYGVARVLAKVLG